MENETNLKSHKVTLITYRPFKQEIDVEAKNGDEAVDLALDNIDYSKFYPSAELKSCEVEVYDVSPDDW
jgi:hypothetical protein